jgi:hypothetical protein
MSIRTVVVTATIEDQAADRYVVANAHGVVVLDANDRMSENAIARGHG